MCCLLLYAGGYGPDPVVAEYVQEAYQHLDMLTGDDCLVFVSHLRGNGSPAVEVAKALGVPVDAMPCCVFLAAGSDRKRAVVPIGQVVTDEGISGLEALMQAITQAARDAAALPAGEQVARLCEALERKHTKTSYAKQTAAPANPTSKLSAGACVVAALAAVAKLFGFG